MQVQQNIPWHAMHTGQALTHLVSTQEGLSVEEAASRLEQFGPNVISEAEKVSPVVAFIKQFQSPLIYILLIAAILSFASNHITDGLVIMVVVILNAVIGFIQEYKAERSLEALKKLAALRATVIREGDEKEINSPDLVPGDMIILEAGDKVPADARIITSANAKADESVLTGESVPSDKNPETVDVEKPIHERTNIVFSGTTFVYGRAMALVTETGMSTQIGQIAAEVALERPQPTPVQKKLSRLAGNLGIAGLIIALLIVGIGIFRKISLFDTFFIGVAAAVSFIPEGLPAVITIVLAVGVQKMARRCAIIRKLPAVETLGSATVICSDKTGTLTKNEMTVKTGYTAESPFTITGEGYNPEGSFYIHGQQIEPAGQSDIDALITALVLCNDSRLHLEDDSWRVLGDPTEGALVVAGEKYGLRKHDLEAAQPRIGEIPFDSQKRFMVTFHLLSDGRTIAYMKGAPEDVLSMCNRYLSSGGPEYLDKDKISEFSARNAEMASGALRILASAYKELPTESMIEGDSHLEADLIYLGAVGMIDPPREEARNAIQAAKEAGVRTIMVTGDHPDTARTVAELLGLLEGGMRVVPARTIDRMTDEQLSSAIGRIAVFARAEPEHKIRIIKALKSRGKIVAMTGDGVNDAPALKLADIGVAMGITGTDVAKEASDMILLDDNYATIVTAVEEGRAIFANIRRVVLYLLSTNTGEILTYLSALIAGLPIPLLPVQILWVNLVTDGFNTVPLSLEPKKEGLLREPPRSPQSPVVNRSMMYRIVFVALFMTLGTLLLFIWGISADGLPRARTYAFVTIALFQIFNVLNVRSRRYSVFKIGILTNWYVIAGIILSVITQIAAIQTPFLQKVLDTVPLSFTEWMVCVGVSSTVFLAEEIRKLIAPMLFAPGRLYETSSDH